MKIKFRELKNSLFTEENIKIGTKVFKVAALMYFCRRIPVFAQDENDLSSFESFAAGTYEPPLSMTQMLLKKAKEKVAEKAFQKSMLAPLQKMQSVLYYGRVSSTFIAGSSILLANSGYFERYRKNLLFLGVLSNSLSSCLCVLEEGKVSEINVMMDSFTKK